MAKKKRQHYIPRFYLKRFSVNDQGKYLGLFNLMNKKFVQHATLRDQAYKNFLYGNDDIVENKLAAMEGVISNMFYYWTDEKQFYPPPTDSNGFKLLKRFILCQIFRTPGSGNDLIETVNESMKTFAKEFDLDLLESLKDLTLAHENPVLLGLLRALEYEHLLNFMECKFLVNLSFLPFITSDSPVICYNQLMECAENYKGATGLPAKGLQIFYPIHPRLMICLYDSDVYDFGNGCINCCSTESIDEVNQLNGLQLANCKSQLFFNDFITEDYIDGLLNCYGQFRGTLKNIYERISQGDTDFFLTTSEDIHLKLSLDFFRLKVNPNDFKNEFAPVRHPSLERIAN